MQENLISFHRAVIKFGIKFIIVFYFLSKNGLDTSIFFIYLLSFDVRILFKIQPKKSKKTFRSNNALHALHFLFFFIRATALWKFNDTFLFSHWTNHLTSLVIVKWQPSFFSCFWFKMNEWLFLLYFWNWFD